MVQTLISFALVTLSALSSTVLARSHRPTAGNWTGWHGLDEHPYQGQWLPCNQLTIEVRQDFEKMAPKDRKAYTDAVKCLMDLPSEFNDTMYPGAISRFFDYSAVHINQTKAIHLNGFFLTWHRMFIWLYERDLKTKCGYNGTQPYWNWPATAHNLSGSAIFDGSEFSMSGDGIYNNTGPLNLSESFQLPHGSGGGCVTTGPFAYMNYTMASIPTTIVLQNQPLPPTAFDYRPQCLTRDLNTFVAKTQTNATLWEAAVAAPDAATFELLVNGKLGGGQLGLHSGAHFTVGSPGSSLFASPQDPVWYPLHAMLDYTYWTWQQRHPNIAHTLSGTETAVNLPPSANVTLTTQTPDWSYLFPSLPIGDLVSTTAGPFCYTYE